MNQEYNQTTFNLYPSNCFLIAQGTDFEPESFLSESVFYTKRIIYKGSSGSKRFEWVGEVRPRKKVFFDNKHLILLVSDSKSFKTQIEQARLFLKKYADETIRLSKFPGVEQVILIFAPWSRIPSDSLPDDLIELASNSGISLTV